MRPRAALLLALALGPPRARSFSAPARRRGLYESFDWTKHWYPVGWCRDFEVDKPTKVTLFDTDYVVVRRPEGLAPLGMLDRCPHRMAALSEGRVTKQGFIQCAYHGWAFNGSTGACASVPQAAEPGSAPPARACATAVRAEAAQGLIWLHPWNSQASRDEIPTMPEMEEGSGYKFGASVRDFPVDYSIIVENVIDPDHGLFAHQEANFDFYTATREAPQKVEVVEEPGGSSPFSIRSETVAAKKWTAGKATGRGKAKKPSAETAPPLRATHRFIPPCHIQIARRDETGASKFITTFWLVPVGVGRCRFLAASVSKIVAVKRWLLHIILNNFLDQDTHLLATLQPSVLEKEWAAHAAARERGGAAAALGDGGGAGEGGAGAARHGFRRRAEYVYQSASERFLIEVGRFLDATVPRMPGRYSSTAAWQRATGPCPPREYVLDRWRWHTSLCPDSMAAVRNLRALRNCGAGACAAALALLRPGLGVWPLVLAAAGAGAAFGAWKVEREFHFKYNTRLRDRDLAKIPAVFPDERLLAATSPQP